MKSKYKLKNKKRFSIFISILVLITLTTILTNTVYGFKQPRYNLITVRQGDTLWDIAKKSDSNKDIREFIYEIKAVNNLNNSEIYQGTVLKIPAE
jgi:LysM repeat protein